MEKTLSWSEFKELFSKKLVDPKITYNIYHDDSEKLKKFR